MDPDKKTRLGNRFTCYSCGCHFYDLNKPEPICPKCQADQREQPAEEVKPKAKKAKRVRKKAAKKPKIIPALMVDDEPKKEEAIDSQELKSEAGLQIELDD